MSKRLHKGTSVLLLLIYAAGILHFVLPLHSHACDDQSGVPLCGFCVLFTTAAVVAPIVIVRRLPAVQPVSILEIVSQRRAGVYRPWSSRAPPALLP
ncbi:MAG: hypothetical protein IT368_13180 [Candidatus Hydrogenedentes bacterium]|nr:hypothetical protein [Candidatus Hydrogenedentota bacterium]